MCEAATIFLFEQLARGGDKVWCMCCALHLTPHTSHLTPHTSHLTPHTSHLTPHTPHLTPHTSHLDPLQIHRIVYCRYGWVRQRSNARVSCNNFRLNITSHLPPPTFHLTHSTSHITPHTFHLTHSPSHLPIHTPQPQTPILFSPSI